MSHNENFALLTSVFGFEGYRIDCNVTHVTEATVRDPLSL